MPDQNRSTSLVGIHAPTATGGRLAGTSLMTATKQPPHWNGTGKGDGALHAGTEDGGKRASDTAAESMPCARNTGAREGGLAAARPLELKPIIPNPDRRLGP